MMQLMSVKDYGAYGDDTHDDTQWIEAALAAAGTAGCSLWFPKGIYRCNVTVSNRVPLIGEGPEHAILKS